MPPYDLWLAGRDDIFSWWLGPGIGCRGSRVITTPGANGAPAFGQYKPTPAGGYEPWALQVLEIENGPIAEFTFFLDTHALPALRPAASARVVAAVLLRCDAAKTSANPMKATSSRSSSEAWRSRTSEPYRRAAS